MLVVVLLLVVVVMKVLGKATMVVLTVAEVTIYEA